MRKVLSIVFSLNLVFGNAQEKVWVFFKDKPNVDNQILQPEKYLSSQSLERRASQNIDLHPTDFPVESSYLNEIRNLNIPVVRSSKWLNASSVYVSSQIEIDLLEALPFVEKVSPVKALKMTEVESFYKTKNLAFSYQVFACMYTNYSATAAFSTPANTPPPSARNSARYSSRHVLSITVLRISSKNSLSWMGDLVAGKCQDFTSLLSTRPRL